MANKFALIIGVEYTAAAQEGTLDRLPGCANDALMVRDWMQNRYSVPPANIQFLCDAHPTGSPPTRAGIVQAIRTLVSRAKLVANAQVWVSYSGHGGSVRDTGGDERDGLDEVLFPADFLQAGIISDDQLHTLLFSQMRPDAHVFCLMDCCHSGTSLDLRYRLQGSLAVRESAKSIVCSAACISGCADDQTSASAYNLDKRNSWRGALTWAVGRVLDELDYAHVDANTLLTRVRAMLAERQFEQVPQLASSADPVTAVIKVPWEEAKPKPVEEPAPSVTVTPTQYPQYPQFRPACCIS